MKEIATGIESLEIENFETDSIYLGSFITTDTEIPPKYKDHSGLTWLCYPKTPEVLSAIDRFFNGGLVNCYVFSSILKRMRGEVINRRKRGGNGDA